MIQSISISLKNAARNILLQKAQKGLLSSKAAKAAKLSSVNRKAKQKLNLVAAVRVAAIKSFGTDSIKLEDFQDLVLGNTEAKCDKRTVLGKVQSYYRSERDFRREVGSLKVKIKSERIYLNKLVKEASKVMKQYKSTADITLLEHHKELIAQIDSTKFVLSSLFGELKQLKLNFGKVRFVQTKKDKWIYFLVKARESFVEVSYRLSILTEIGLI